MANEYYIKNLFYSRNVHFKYSITLRQNCDYEWRNYRRTKNSNEQSNSVFNVLRVNIN